MAKVNNDCIQKGYFTREEAEVCQKQLGADYEVKLAMGAVRLGKLMYTVQARPDQFGFFGSLMAFLVGR